MFEIKGASPSADIDFMVSLADQCIDDMMSAVKNMEYAMQFKAFSLNKIYEDAEKEKARFLALTDVLQGCLLRSLERYREEFSTNYTMKYAYTEDESLYDIWLHVKIKESGDDEPLEKASVVVPDVLSDAC